MTENLQKVATDLGIIQNIAKVHEAPEPETYSVEGKIIIGYQNALNFAILQKLFNQNIKPHQIKKE